MFATPSLQADPDARLRRAERSLARERAARLEAEAIAEAGLRRLYESQQRLLLLQRITDGANQAAEIVPALHVAIAEICRHMGWAFGNALLVSADGGASACDTWYAAEPERVFAFAEASRRAAFATGAGLPGRVLADPRPHWVNDVTADGNFPRKAPALACGLAAACAFPVMVGDEVGAVLEFFAHQLMAPDENLMATLGQVGTQLGRVIERDRARRALIHDASHDAMTGLPNRSFFNARMEEAFARAAGPGELAVLVVDLDGFKAVNDSLGHQAGDALLIDVARRMADCVTAAAAEGPLLLARVGGDEFNLLLEGGGAPRAERLAAALHGTLARPNFLAGKPVRAQASIGVAVGDAGLDEVDQLLRNADLAMYEAKATGRARTVVFTSDLGRKVRHRTQVERELRAAIADRQFVLHYQPIVALGGGGGRVCGYEALVRWNHPTRGLLSPAEFIEVAEDSGLILFLGDWVLAEGCRHAARLPALPGTPDPFVSINISPRQFLQESFACRVQTVLIETGVAPSRVRLEVTESVAVVDAKRAAAVLNEIRAWGVRTSLDDFGTGFSSLSYLQALPFDALKIDRSFVAAMAESAESRGIVRAILELARTMRMTVVAEGIETAEQEAMLRDMGCDMGQGFRYGRPARLG